MDLSPQVKPCNLISSQGGQVNSQLTFFYPYTRKNNLRSNFLKDYFCTVKNDTRVYAFIESRKFFFVGDTIKAISPAASKDYARSN